MNPMNNENLMLELSFSYAIYVLQLCRSYPSAMLSTSFSHAGDM